MLRYRRRFRVRRLRKSGWLLLAVAIAYMLFRIWGPTAGSPGRNRVPAVVDRSERFCTVEKVLDGDSVVCANGNTVRYAGIDTPEPLHLYAERARATNRRWVYRRTIRLRVVDVDRYGRLVAFVYRTDWPPPSINERLLSEGLAWVYYFPSVRRYWSRLVRIQRDAMRARRGIWRVLSRRPERLIGNRRSRRFHTERCGYVVQIAPAHRVVFLSRWDAFWAGYAPARECAQPVGE